MVDFQFVYYPVAGRTLGEVQRSIALNAPSKAGDAFFAGLTAWSLNSSYDLIPTPSGCLIGNGTVQLEAKVHLPQLQTPQALSAAALQEWNRFLGALKAHEMLHAQNAHRAAVTLLKKINGTATTVSCPRAKEVAEEAVSALIEGYGDYDRQLDAQTVHGAKQGAYLNTGIR